MKKFLHGLSALLIVLIVLLWGAALIYGNGFDNDLRDSVFAFLQEAPLYGVAIGLILVLLVLLFLATFGPARSRECYISFDSENGSVSISVNAVRDFVRKLSDEFAAIVSLDPKIRPGRDMISLDLDVKVQAGTRIPELSQVLQARVRDSIRDGLGIAEVNEIKVRVREIVGAPPGQQ